MAQYSPSPHLVAELRPEGANGAVGGAYQLTSASASPTRIVGRDEIGLPIEETIPAAYWREFVHPHGHLNKVPMRTSVGGDSMSHERYGQLTERELIAAGWIPSEMCPYSFEAKHITGGAFVKVPAGESDCGGSKADGGCVHLQKVIAGRLAMSKKKHDADQTALHSMKTEDVTRMLEAVSEGVGQAIARQLDPKAAKAAGTARLRDGKGDEV